MYINYKYNANATISDILSDFESFFNSESDVNNLSASCDKTETTIDNTFTNYTANKIILHDADAGTNKKVYNMSKYYSDTSFNYIMLDFEHTANYLYLVSYEDWDNVNHVGVNLNSGCYNESKGTRKIPLFLTDGGRLRIYISDRVIYVYGEDNNGENDKGSFLVEIDKKDYHDTIEMDFPNIVSGNTYIGSNKANDSNTSYYQYGLSKILRLDTAEIKTGNNACNGGYFSGPYKTHYSGMDVYYTLPINRDSDAIIVKTIMPVIWGMTYSYMYVMAERDISKNSGLYFCTGGGMSIGDTLVQDDGKKYIILGKVYTDRYWCGRIE